MKQSTSNQPKKPHAIIVALPLQGHINPTIQLAIKLASNGFSITFINAQHIHHKITRSNPTTTTNIFDDTNLDIEYTTVSDGLPLEYDRSSNHEHWAAAFTHCYPAHVELAVAKVVRDRGSDNKAACLIADSYSSWASTMAKKYGLLYVSFWTEAAVVLDVYFHMHLLVENGHVGPGARDDKIHYIPGVESIKPSDLMSFLQDKDMTTPDHQRLFACINDAKRADFILCNTVHELEIGPISAIQAQIPFYAIGPLISKSPSPISTSLWAESDCTQWLNTKPPKSVLYVSFGSYVHLSKKDVVEISEGIKLSGVDFLWVLRPDTVSLDDPDPLPVGFRDEVSGQGMVVGWTNQKEVLSHSAIGGFLTHCGWNSTLESMWCGVPLLCFPLLNDQFTDRKLVVDDWKIGCNLCDAKFVTREEVSEKIKLVMNGTMGSQFKDNIKEVKQIMCDATAQGGSSQKNLDAFIKDIKTRISLL